MCGVCKVVEGEANIDFESTSKVKSLVTKYFVQPCLKIIQVSSYWEPMLYV